MTELSGTAFTELRDLIYERSGIFFQETKKDILESRLKTRLRERNCASYKEYCDLLKYDAWRDRELSALFDLVTTTETFFYRDLPQLQTFMDVIVPAVMQVNRDARRAQIWSAACSTGDEPYTLAIMMLEHPVLSRWAVNILGSDISEAALNVARQGIYGQYALRHVPQAILRKYFTVQGDRYVLSPDVKRLVKFAHINLYDSRRLSAVRGLDVIFCRNCLVYFDEKARRKVINNLHECLRTGGYLVVGFSESLHNLSRTFRPVHAGRSVVYQKV